MKEASVSLTIYFDGQFYVGLFERFEVNELCVCRYVFGFEPKDYDIYELILRKYNELKFSLTVVIARKPIKRKNPKALQRKIKKTVVEFKVGTKSQQAIKKQMEERKIVRKAKSKACREQERDADFLRRQKKKKEKRKGH
ncbi:MAG: YjdF family protein [Clostridia bacterium]|nr:YjdF family protein [Clostridia bacterium]